MQIPWVGQTEYSEPEMALWAALFVLPVLGAIMAWDPSKWPRAIALWVLASLMTYLYGRWVREDEDE